MAVAEVIYLVAALLWIGAALGGLAALVIVVVKIRARRRRMNRLLDAVRVPVRVCVSQVRAQLPWETMASVQRAPRRRRGAGSGPHRRQRQRL